MLALVLLAIALAVGSPVVAQLRHVAVNEYNSPVVGIEIGNGALRVRHADSVDTEPSLAIPLTVARPAISVTLDPFSTKGHIVAASGQQRAVDFVPLDPGVAWQINRPISGINNPSKVPVSRRRVLDTAIDGLDVYVMYAAIVAGDVVVGHWVRPAAPYRKGELRIRLPTEMAFPEHIAVSGHMVWLSGGRVVARYEVVP